MSGGIRETWFENGIEETASLSVVRLSGVQMSAWGVRTSMGLARTGEVGC